MSLEPGWVNPKRADLHCHSLASNKAAEVVLNAIHCPECYSKPSEVHAQATRRGMDFVTITDHDSIQGVITLTQPNVLTGEELTCWFPEDRCKMHVLVWGIDPSQHEALQQIADNIYEVSAYIERMQIAHAVAHPIYRQNDKLERWHLERLLLMFKGFECLNGAHSQLHREAFEPLLDRLDKQEIEKLSARHQLQPRWNQPWRKARTGGSDDHGLLNIGRTWTEFPDGTTTPAQVLTCLREGRCRPGGEAGSSAKLAHTFYSVAIRYYDEHLLSPTRKSNLATILLQTLVGARPKPTRGQLARLYIRHKAKKIGRRILHPFGSKNQPANGTALLRKLFLDSVKKRFPQHAPLRQALDRGLPPLGEHDEMLKLVNEINHDTTQGIVDAINTAIDQARFTGLFDAISSILAQQFTLLPYYFTVFHQNKERHLLRAITGTQKLINSQTMRIGLFTDTLDDVNGVGRFIRDMSQQALATHRQLTIHTSTLSPRFDLPNRKNFTPLLSRPLPYYADLSLNLPPVLEVLEWADRQQFDVIHISTPGPMGLCGWLVAKMLRVPVLATYHTDFPRYVEALTRDHRITRATTAYMKWLYGQMAAVFSRSPEYHFSLGDLGVADQRIYDIRPGVNITRFNPDHRDDSLWTRHNIAEPFKLLYCGRVSVEKNLPLLVDIFQKLRSIRQDVALVIAGDGPYRQQMQQQLSGMPAYFLGMQNDDQLAALYASSDLFIFPSRTDTLGQVVLEAQACALPVLVSDEGGPRGQMKDDVTGMILSGMDAAEWVQAIDRLLNDADKRSAMKQAAAHRMAHQTLEHSFESFWAEHLSMIQATHTTSNSTILQANRIEK